MPLELGGQFSTQHYRCRPLKCQAEANSFPPPAGHTLPPNVAHHTVHFAWDKQNCEFTLLLVTAGPFHHCCYSFGSLPACIQLCWRAVTCLPDHIKVSGHIKVRAEKTRQECRMAAMWILQHPTGSPELPVPRSQNSPLNFQCFSRGSLRQVLNFVMYCF